MKAEAKIALGTEAGFDGHRIGRDPRKMSQGELRALGHVPMSPLSALRMRCLDCCAGSADEVRKCMSVTCPAWPYRMGVSPWRAPLSEAEKVRRRQILARVGKMAGNSSEPEKSRRPDGASPTAAISAPKMKARRHDPEISEDSPAAPLPGPSTLQAQPSRRRARR
jgi:hypothetical protein